MKVAGFPAAAAAQGLAIEGDEEDLAEMMEGVASVAGGGKRAEGVEAFGEALGIVGFVGISGHPRSLKTPDMEYKSVSFPWVVFSLMEGPCLLIRLIFQMRACFPAKTSHSLPARQAR